MISVTEQLGIMLPDGILREQAEKYLLPKPNGEYTDQDVRNIIEYYLHYCAPVQVNPLLAIAQMCVETGNLSSYWASRPRCNPAGIGVTGAPGAGIVFGTWSRGVLAHIGRLIAYATSPGSRTPPQQDTVDYALKWRDLPVERQGTAISLADLAGFWAADPAYASTISRVANDILKA